MRFFAPGIPQPKGSKTHVGGGVMLDARRPKSRKAYAAWCESLGWSARIARDREPAWNSDAPGYTLTARFYFVPPASRGRGLDGYAVHNDKPDLDKLLRCALDVFSGVLIADDKRVAHLGELSKWYHPTRAGAEIEILPLTGSYLPQPRRRRAEKSS